MTTQPLPLDDGLLTIPKRLSTVIQIKEVPLASPTMEWPEETSQSFVEVVGKSGSETWDSQRSWAGFCLNRPRSGEGWLAKERPSKRFTRRRSSLSSIDGETGDGPDNFYPRRRPLLTLPHYGSVDNAVSSDRHQRMPRSEHKDDVSAACIPVSTSISIPGAGPLGAFGSQPWLHSSPLTAQSLAASCGVVPPLTPPEESASFNWEAPSFFDSEEGVRTVMDVAGRSARNNHAPNSSNATSRPSEIQMPARSDLNPDETGRSNWLGRACQHLVSALGDESSQPQLQMVVQALPSQAKSSTTRPVFEKVVEEVQGRSTYPPYITITHAVSQVISMDEVPASPPATPNTNYSSSDDYFQDQTVFTHAAAVPAYHSQTQLSTASGSRSTNIIAAPSSIHMSILERYLPPTTAQEVNDFFTLSKRSYLADRLLELSANNGSLLLVYPTKLGGSTFANKYIGPVIEPFLRQFILLNSLYMELAIQLGRMAGVAGMKSFEEMRQLLEAMCRELGQRAPSRGLPSRYDVVHAETAEVVLDRALWKEWFVEQEQPRLRQNLVDYHKSGGRMPARRGQIEITPGMLAREVVDGIRHSREPAGEAGIEIGVFVIRRTLV
ncbi:hypothetical protein ABEF95_007843 [Exophiala dermatitidis]